MGLLPEKLDAPVVFGAVLAGLLCVPSPAQADPHPWAPPPVNLCGEVGFDPLLRQPDPSLPPPPPVQIPPRIEIPVPVPEFTPVPVPDPPQDNTRVKSEPLPADPCRNPCPDVRDTPEPEESTEPETPDTGSGSGSSSGSGRFELPRLEIKPEIEPIPIPYPGDDGAEPQPAPPRVVHPAEPGPVAEPVAGPQVERVELVSQVTGHGSLNRTDLRWQVDGTDLGLMWETEPGKVAVVFGDTFGAGWVTGGAGGPDWRSNVLGFSTDRHLEDGLTIDSFVQDSRCHAAEFLASRKIKNWETTVIPTSGFALGARQYLSYMSVNRWSRIPGLWSTNYGGIAYSDDGGSTWVKDEHAKWDNMFGRGRFQVAAMVPQGDYVYMFGTPNGRIGMIALARVPKAEVLNKSAYQYWVDGNWAPAAENGADPIVLGLASEISVRYDAAAEQWQMVYLDPGKGAIVVRNAAAPQGIWTEAATLVTTADYPKSYGGFIHPWSTSEDLYFTMSAWDSYNVYLMRAKLKPSE
ncbi:DUF4185 domain-containing protein [Nocardia goodfellowii]|uniref:DUF4185 domain-containing protein n=1 Tax=Nocardia goodfellowii TaxID=882446 RepID=A0ABS4Q992_9NOCA|nr:DUF4185 domain-containing protein [Nocardia goodfellowii]MBP2188256.1 hypothetical protein [Nocardia goodfellowii]